MYSAILCLIAQNDIVYAAGVISDVVFVLIGTTRIYFLTAGCQFLIDEEVKLKGTLNNFNFFSKNNVIQGNKVNLT